MATKTKIKTKIKTRDTQPEPEFTPEQFRGIVCVQAMRCHGMLPQGMRNSVDVSDLVQEGMMFLTRVIYRKGGRKAEFCPTRAAASTWVYSLLTNFYRGWHDMHVAAKKRKVDLVELDDNPVAQNHHAASSRYPDVVDAFNKVEDLHRHASLDLVEFLDMNLFQSPDRVAKARGHKFEVLATEFRQLTRRFNVTIDDYRIVMRSCTRQEV